jgi:hypothetical protein
MQALDIIRLKAGTKCEQRQVAPLFDSPYGHG